MKLTLIFTFLLLLANPEGLNAQSRISDRSQQQLLRQQAETLVRLGRPDEAVDLYRELIRQDPRNTSYYFRIAQLLPGVENAEELLLILEEVLAQQRGQSRLLAEKGRLMYILDLKEEAITHWERMLSRYGRSRAVYNAVTSAQLQAGAVDLALSVLEKGREELDDQYAFALELARVHAARMNTVAASLEYLNHLRRSPAMENYISQQIIELGEKTAYPDSLEMAIIRHLASEDPAPGSINVLCKYYLNMKQYDQLVGVLLESEQMAELKDIAEFAKQLLAEQAYDQAAELYLYISAQTKEAKLMTEALLGLAKSYEERLNREPEFVSIGGYFPGNSLLELDIRPTHEGTGSLERALSLYDSLSTLVPRSYAAFQATYNIADMQLTILEDFDAAIRGFKMVMNQTRNPVLRLDAATRLVDSWLAKGDTSRATTVLEQMTEEYQLDVDDPELIHSRIKIYLHAGNLEALQKELLNLSGAALPSNPLFNDGLELQALMEDNGGSEDARLAQYMEAERLIGQHKMSEAVRRLLAINGRAESIADESRVRAIQILLLIDKGPEAYAAMESFLQEFENSPWRAQVLTWYGEYIQYQLEDPVTAVPVYEEILINHPGYLYLQDVRLRIRSLLGGDS